MMLGVMGVSVALPGAAEPGALLDARYVASEPVDPAALIGRKGLRFKDQATRVGLHLAFGALTDAGLYDDGATNVPGDRVATVVSSNLGNADTVCRAVETIAKESTAALSPMDTPNVSSNIIASEIAIRYGLRGPNLSVCNGSSSGLDAVRWAALLLRSGRADHVVVIGVESDNEVTRQLLGKPVADGGAALVLGRFSPSARARVGPVVRTDGPASAARSLTRLAPDPALWLAPEIGLVPEGTPRRRLEDWGELSGAGGVVQCAAAAGWFDRREAGPVCAVAGGTGAVLFPPEVGR